MVAVVHGQPVRSAPPEADVETYQPLLLLLLALLAAVLAAPAGGALNATSGALFSSCE